MEEPFSGKELPASAFLLDEIGVWDHGSFNYMGIKKATIKNMETGNVPQQPKTHPFEKALEELINKHSMENDSDTPDFILAQYMFSCLTAYRNAVNARDKWFGVDMWQEDKIRKNDILEIEIDDQKILTQGRPEFWQNAESGNWEKNTFETVKFFAFPGKIFIDIGAWVGAFSIYASKLGAKVVAVEPDEVAFKELERNIRLNDIEASLVDVAISDKTGVAVLNSTGEFGNSESSLVFRGFDGKTKSVIAWTFEGLVRDYKIDLENVCLIKVDIEGGEVAFLKNAEPLLVKYKPAMHLSIHPLWIGEEGVDQIADIIFKIYNVHTDSGLPCFTKSDFKEAIESHQHSFVLTAKFQY